MNNSELDDDIYECKSTKSQVSSTNSIMQPLLDSQSSSCVSVDKISLGAILFERNTKLVKACVMLTVILERAAYYSLLGNLGFFVNAYLNYTPNNAAELVLGFSGMTWLSCFIGGILGDTFLGRYKTILVGLLLYVIGFTMLPLLKYVANPDDNVYVSDGRQPLFVFWLLLALFVISLGEGCFKSNMSPFGADQVQEAQDFEMRTFFNYFYWAINIGSFIGFSALTLIQQEYGFITGYIVPSCLLLLGLIIFYLPRSKNYQVK